MTSNPEAVQVSRWPAILFLLWNLMGCAAFVMQSTQDLADLAQTDPLQAKIWSDMPLWAWISYGIAVVAGLLGAITLLLQRRVAVPLAAICVIAVILQFCYTFFLTDLLAMRGFSTAIFPAIIILLAVAQFLYARMLGRRGALR